MKKIIVLGCGQCPYSSGWDFQKNCPEGMETIFCAAQRMIGPTMTGKDRAIGNFKRRKYKQAVSGRWSDKKLLDIPIPKWCPLEEAS